MRKKIGIMVFSMVFVVLIVFCIIIGRVTAGSYVDNVELEQYLSNPDLMVVYCGMGYDAVTNRGYLDNEEIQSVDDLLTADVVVAKVKLQKNFQRKIYYECVFSKLDIIKCYQGNLEEGGSICIFEPVDCVFKDQMMCTDGYSLMQEEKEYIVFLKPLQNTYYGSDKYVYAPYCTLYSKYPVDNNTPRLFSYEELEEMECLYPYSKIRNEEAYLYEQKEYDKYLKLKKEVMRKYSGRNTH